MNRRSSTIVVLGLFLIGLAVCLKQTLDVYNDLESSVSSTLLTAEALLAVIIFGAGIVMVRREFSKRRRFTRPTRLEAFAHVRRLLAAVWS